MNAKVIGLTPKALVERFSGKKKPERKHKSFSYKPDDLDLRRVSGHIQQLSDQELMNILVYELIRRNVKDGYLGDLAKKIQETKKDIKLERERKQKESVARATYQRSWHNKFRLLAQQNSVVRTEALNEWPLSSLKGVLRQISDKRRLEGVSDHMLRMAKVDLVRIIQEKTALGE